MRMDKYLKVSRILKRREVAKELCEDGDVLLNGRRAKPMSEVNPGDIITLRLGRHLLKAKVLEVREYAKKDDAGKMFEILSDEVKNDQNN